jgi:uncharacterized protein YoxC
MKTIKKYWLAIVAGIAAIFGLFLLFSSKRSKTKLDQIEDQIEDNNEQIDVIEDRVEDIQQQREEIKQDIQQTESEIEDLKQQVAEVNPEVRPVTEARENILNKTRRRSRKPKNT